MNRPTRTRLSTLNLSRRGVPKKFHHLSIKDFEHFNNEDLKKIKDFMENYLNNLHKVFDSNEGILFYGSNGSGKTMLSSLIVKEAYKYRYTSKRATFVQYISEYTRVWGERDKEEAEEVFYNDFKAVEFLVLEEVGKEIDSKISSPILEDCLRYREDHGLVTIICSNLTPKDLVDKYGMSIGSLIKGNCVPIKIESKDQRNNSFKERCNK